MPESQPLTAKHSLRGRLHEIIFEDDTPAGKAFDVILIWCIAISIGAVVIDSVATVHQTYGRLLHTIEWFFTILFTVEYLLRLLCVQRPGRYAASFFGIVDLLAILPTYLSFIVPGGHSLLTIRLLRVLRIFRVLKLSHYLSEASPAGHGTQGQPQKDQCLSPGGGCHCCHHRCGHVHR